jgi:hypothetical protein
MCKIKNPMIKRDTNIKKVSNFKIGVNIYSILNSMKGKSFEGENLNLYKRLSNTIIKKSILKKVTSKVELLKLIKNYYENVAIKNISELEYEKISIENDIDNIKENRTLLKYIGIISLAITVSIFLYNFVYSINYNMDLDNKSKIATDNNLMQNYESKILELENKIKFSKNLDDKNQMEDYDMTLKQEIEKIKKRIEVESNYRSNMFTIVNDISLLPYCITIFTILLIIDEISANCRINKKQYLKMKLAIINLILKNKQDCQT